MRKILVEVIGTHGCTGCNNSLPEVVQQFCEDTGIQVEYRFYPVWDLDGKNDTSAYILTHIEKMKKGMSDSNGFFLNGQWLPLAHHNTEHVVEARKRLIEAAEVELEIDCLRLFGRSIEELKIDGSKVKTLNLANSAVHELGSFSTSFEYIWFFEGSIKKLSIDACPVEEFTYMGYDINKLIEIANRHPEIFKNNETGNNIARNIAKANIDDVNIRLLTLQDLHEGYHPCIINGCKIDQNSKLHAAVAEKFGGWGYVATCGSKTCGFMGIIPKDISYRDAGYLPPCELPNEIVLLLTCYAGGGVFGEEFNLIGIAKKMIFQAINDAKEKGYLRVEAYAHPEVEPVLIKCGFTSVEWKTEMDVPQVYYKLDL
jgi:hypothetical protein